MQSPAELRTESHFHTEKARKATDSYFKRAFASKAFALAQLAEKIEREKAGPKEASEADPRPQGKARPEPSLPLICQAWRRSVRANGTGAARSNHPGTEYYPPELLAAFGKVAEALRKTPPLSDGTDTLWRIRVRLAIPDARVDRYVSAAEIIWQLWNCPVTMPEYVICALEAVGVRQPHGASYAQGARALRKAASGRMDAEDKGDSPA